MFNNILDRKKPFLRKNSIFQSPKQLKNDFFSLFPFGLILTEYKYRKKLHFSTKSMG